MATHPLHTKEGGLNLDEFLCFAIYSAGHAFNQFYRPLLSEIGLTYPQYLAMVSLWSRDGKTVKELGEAMFLESSTLTPLLKRLEALKLVTRRRDPADERQVFIELTAGGRALRARLLFLPAFWAQSQCQKPRFAPCCRTFPR